jgi:hypothetical protein
MQHVPKVQFEIHGKHIETGDGERGEDEGEDHGPERDPDSPEKRGGGRIRASPKGWKELPLGWKEQSFT